MTEFTYTFDDREDAALYLRQVGLLWGVWVIALGGLFFTHAGLLIAWGVITVTSLLFLARPLQRRAEKAAPENEVEGGVINTALRGGTTRDRVLRDLSYGGGPLRAALETLGLSQRWMVVRHLVIAITLVAMVFVIFGPRPA
ncbi:MAG: hypothetical protein GY722_16040 [bacterium]|nr:hypothetical protein [bacterium]